MALVLRVEHLEVARLVRRRLRRRTQGRRKRPRERRRGGGRDRLLRRVPGSRRKRRRTRVWLSLDTYMASKDERLLLGPARKCTLRCWHSGCR